MGQRLELLPKRVDVDTVQVLTDLLQSARDGKITGIAYVAANSSRDFSGDVVGAVKDQPILALGLLLALEAKILNTLP